MEELLHYIWKHKLWFATKVLQTTTGDAVEIIDPGLHNHDAGPDFFNAKVKINGTLWVGNVEIHTSSSDWFKHGHQTDPKYDNVILHVIKKNDAIIYHRTNGEAIPQLILDYPIQIEQRLEQLKRAEKPCIGIIKTLPKLKIHSWMSSLLVERLEQKTSHITLLLQQCDKDWSHAFFISLARSLGLGLNSDTMERWAWRIPMQAIEKHKDNLTQLEALFLGQGGFIYEDLHADSSILEQYKHEFAFMKSKFNLPNPIDVSHWKLLRLRPANFPTLRLAQLAMLYHQSKNNLFSELMNTHTIEDIKAILEVNVSPYWQEHYSFKESSIKKDKHIGNTAQQIIIINTIIPFLYAYGKHRSNETLADKASILLESLWPENNRIIRQWEQDGIHPEHAADTQALIELERQYCEHRDCLRCRFGYEYLKKF